MKLKPYLNRENKTLYLNRVINQTQILKVNPNLEYKEVNVFMTAVNKDFEEDFENYKTAKKNQDNKTCLEILNKYINTPIDFNNIIMYGDANQQYKGGYTSYDGLLDKLTRKDRSNDLSYAFNTTKFYRNYEQRQEAWQDTCSRLNMCPDFKMSWQSALRILGAKKVNGLKNKFIPFYVVIWCNTDSIEDVQNSLKL